MREDSKIETVKGLQKLIKSIEAGELQKMEVSVIVEFDEDGGRYGDSVERKPTGWRTLSIRYYLPK